MSAPRVSVVMPVRNVAAYVADAVTSILAQRFEDWELIVVDDGSDDGTAAVLANVRDPRVRSVRQPASGITAALNRSIALCQGELIARMDGDDVALPDRLARQVAFLDAHPEVGVLGTGWRELLPNGRVVDVPPPVTDDAGLRALLPKRNPFAHPTVVVRRHVGDAVGWYDERWPVAQDYDLWIRLAAVTRFANLPEPLLLRRLTPGMTSLARDDLRLETEARLKWRAIRRGDLPPWAVVYALRSVLVRAVPPGIRAARRRRRREGLGRVERGARDGGAG